MKRFWAAVCILLFLLGACIASAVTVNNFSKKAISHLEIAMDYAEKKNYISASRYCSAAAKHWSSKTGLLGALLRHSEADQVESGLAKLVSYSETADHDEFMALCAEVIHDIRHVRDMELPLLRNIL